jgi:hypothetical protein
VASQSLHDIASSLLEVVGGQQLETRHELGEVVGDAGLDEAVDAALLVELDVLDLAAEHVGESGGDLSAYVSACENNIGINHLTSSYVKSSGPRTLRSQLGA